MRKFECKGCENHCKLTPKNNCFLPKFCPFEKGYEPVWREIKEDSAENAHTSVKSEPLPDWVKVGAIGWNEFTGYFEITAIGASALDVLYFDKYGTTSKIGNITILNSYEANKRPFHEHELDALVGKIFQDHKCRVMQIVGSAYSKIFTLMDTYTAQDLINHDFVIDGKPCYVLEHLNDKGEWVK